MNGLLEQCNQTVPARMPRVAVYLPDDLYKCLEDLSRTESRSLSKMVVVLVEEAVESRSKTARNADNTMPSRDVKLGNVLPGDTEDPIDILSKATGNSIEKAARQLLLAYVEQLVGLGIAQNPLISAEEIRGMAESAVRDQISRRVSKLQEESDTSEESS